MHEHVCKTCIHRWYQVTNTNKCQTQTCIENCPRLIGASYFWGSHGRYLSPLWFDILATPMCVCVSIVSACISLNTSHTSHSLPPNGIIHCSLILLVWNLHRRESFSLSPSALRLWSEWGKLIIDFIKQWGCWPLGAENERLEGTLPEWIHFLHNPLQSSSSHHCATGGAGVTH